MKKKLTIGICVILLLAAAFGIYYRLKPAQTNIDQILPQGVLWYVELLNTGKRWQEFRNSRLWHNLEKINIEEILSRSGVPEKEISKYTEYKNRASTFFSKLILSEFFSKDVGIAVYPVNISRFSVKDALNALSSIIIITRIKPGANFAEAIAGIYGKLGKNKITRENYNNYKITRVPLTYGLSIYYTNIKDFLIIAAGKKYIHSCIDAFNRKIPSLSKDNGYKWAKSYLPHNYQSMSYINLKEYTGIVKKLANTAKISGQIEERINNLCELYRGLETVGRYSVKDKGVYSSVIHLKVNSHILPAGMKNVFLSRPGKNKALEFVPQETIYYHWTNTFNAKTEWQRLKKSLSEKYSRNSASKNAAAIFSNISSILGINIERDILPLIGNEVGVALSDIDTSGYFPLPKFFIFLKVNNTSTVKKIVEDMINKQKIPIKDEYYKNVKIDYTFLPFGIKLKPAYTVLGNYLIISSSKKLLEKSIDTYKKDSPSIKDNHLFKSVDYGISGENIDSSFANVKVIISKAEDIAELYLKWLSTMKKMQMSQIEILNNSCASLNRNIDNEQKTISSLEKKAKSINDNITVLKSNGADASGEEKKLSSLNAKISTEKLNLSGYKGKLNNCQRELNMLKQSGFDKTRPELTKFYYNKIVIPIMEGLKELNAYGRKTTISGNVLKTTFYCKFE